MEKMTPEEKKDMKFGCVAISIIVLIIAGILYFVFSPGKQEKESDVHTETKIAEENQLQNETVFIFPSLDVLKEQFNDFSKDTDINISDIEINEENTSSFKASITDYLFLIGDLNEDGSIFSISLLSSNDGTLASSANQLLAIAGMIAAQNPSLKPKERGKIMEELGILGSDVDVESINSKYIKNHVRYAAHFIEGVLFFSMSPESGEIN